MSFDEVLKAIGVFLLALTIHELLHWLELRVFGYKPDLKLKWWGILVGSNIWKDVKPTVALISLIVGVIGGWFTITMFYDTVPTQLTIAYWAMCCIDLANIQTILTFKSFWNIKSIKELEVKE